MSNSTLDADHSGTRFIRAPAEAIYRALLDPEAVAAWRAPAGMTCQVLTFEPREGGAFRMTLSYNDSVDFGSGKTSEGTDMIKGRFLELDADRRVVELVEFESDDPAIAGHMRVITTTAPAPGGTEVRIRCEDVPRGISVADHRAGIASTLENLAAFVERH